MFAAGLAVITLMPLVQLQLGTPLVDAGATWTRARSLPRIGETITNTITLALGSVAIALVLGTLMAWWIRGCRREHGCSSLRSHWPR